MSSSKRFVSKGGVQIANDFRDNLIVDRYDPVFVAMRLSKLKHLCSENSEDAVTWNVFRSLRQIDPAAWLPELVRRGLGKTAELPSARVAVSLWVNVAPPAGLLAEGDEGISEIDIVLEAPTWVWFIEAKYGSDISTGTTTRPFRDQLLRNIDVGSYHAGVRDFYFSLLVKSTTASPKGAEMVDQYSSLSRPRELLSHHRPDGLANLKTVSLLTWSDLASVLVKAAEQAIRNDEHIFAERALAWLQSKALLPSS